MTYFDEHPDDRDFTYSTDAQWDRAAARELGAANTDAAWVLTDRDVWHRNPYYTGPAVPHPESDDEFCSTCGGTGFAPCDYCGDQEALTDLELPF